MNLAGILLLWFFLGTACVLIGTVLTGRRLVRSQEEPLVRRLGPERIGGTRRLPGSCVRCAQPLEMAEDARYCGACGLRVRRKVSP